MNLSGLGVLDRWRGFAVRESDSDRWSGLEITLREHRGVGWERRNIETIDFFIQKGNLTRLP